MELSPRSRLLSQLAVVDRAIEKLAHDEDTTRFSTSAPAMRSPNRGRSILAASGASLIASSSSSKLPAPTFINVPTVKVKAEPISKDESYRIVTKGAQPVICQFCVEEVDARLLEKHLAMDCKNRLISCPNHECGVTLHKQNLKWHLKNECVASMTRQKLVEQSQSRASRQEEEEAERLLAVAAVAKVEIAQHPRLMTPSTARTEDMRPAIQMVLCADCSESMRESQLPHHLAEDCKYRRVMCPNYGFGCKEQAIPLINIRVHILSECKAESYRKAMMAKSKQRMEKVQCSTCGEFVMIKDWRRHETELCENRLVPCKNCHFGCEVMVPMKEKQLHELVDESYARHGVYFNGLGSHLNINENDIICPWSAEIWIYRPLPQESMKLHVLNTLLQIPAYFVSYAAEVVIKDKVLELVRSLKEDVSKSKEEQAAFAKLSKAERTIWQNEKLEQRMHRVNELTAMIPTYSDAVLAYLKAFQSVAICVEAGLGCAVEWRLENKGKEDANEPGGFCLLTEYPGKLGGKGGHVNHVASSTHAAVDDEGDEKDPPSLTRSLSFSLDSVSSGTGTGTMRSNKETEGNKMTKRIQTYTSSTSCLAKYFESCFYAESLKTIAAIEAALAAANAEADGADDASADNVSVGTIGSKSASARANAAGEVSVVDGASSLEGTEETKGNEEKEGDAIPTDAAEGTKADEANGDDDLDDALQDAIFAGVSMPDSRPVPIEATWTRFLFDWAVNPKVALKEHHLSWTEWNGLLQDVANLLKEDFDKLQDWRIEAGLITPDVKGGGFAKRKAGRKESGAVGDSPRVATDSPRLAVADEPEEGTSKKDKAARKKEKDRQRRELKKIKALEQEATNSPAGAVDGTNSPHTGSTKEVKLLSRTTELLRSGCGAEIIMDSNTVNADGNRSRICLSMYSGLSILQPASYDEDIVDHHYELLIPYKEMGRLCLMRGYAGIVSAAVDGTPITEVLGSQAYNFGAKVPRGRWTHLAFITTKQKMTLYIDGTLTTSLKDNSIPLPMMSLGGSPFSCLSFRGVVLDARYWDHQRGANQVLAQMHRLIKLAQPDNRSKQKKKKSEDDGLIAWWTFEDGPGFVTVTDITRHRFKTQLHNEITFPLHFSVGPADRYPVPYQVLHEIPAGLHVLIPNDMLREIGFAELGSDENSDAEKERKHRLEILRKYLCRWQWIQVETIAVQALPEKRELAVVPKPPSPGKKKKSSLPSYLGLDEEGEAAGTNMPIPSFREVNICPFEIRRLKLAKMGRQLQKTLKCPLGCGEELRLMDKRFHVRYACPRRFMRCRYDFCGSLFPVEEQDLHERTQCALVSERERWLKRAILHTTLLPCPLCSEAIQMRDLIDHQANECEQRLIFCPYSDCSLGMNPRKIDGGPELVEESKPVEQPAVVEQPFSHWGAPVEPAPVEEMVSADQTIKPQLPAHRLSHHLQFDCTSLKRKMLFMLVERARERHPYPRPWGVAVEV